MINPRHRLSKIDERLSAVVKERKRKDQKYAEAWVFNARHHATAVAAIVQAGQPKIYEPLKEAWSRALKHYEVECRPGGGIKGQIEAAEKLRPKILGGKEQSARLSEIFAGAPVWLTQFTGLAWDAHWVKLTLPDISQTMLNWGDVGYEDARQWPLLPSGTLTAGDPIASHDWRRIWLIGFCMVKDGDFAQAVKERSSAEPEPIPSTGDAFLDEMLWATAYFADERPIAALPPYERRRILKLSDRASRLKESRKRKRRS
jgi:hypothetical protein